MTIAPIAGLLVVLLTAGCAGTDRAPEGGAPKAGTIEKPGPATATAQATTKPEEVAAAQPSPVVAKQNEPVAAVPGGQPAQTSANASAGANVSKSEAPAAKPAAKVPAPAEPTPKKEAAAPAPKPVSSALDLATLEKRLKETNAIGVFTKLTIKNQVDDLLKQFRAYYEGRLKTALAQLRQSYDLLILKVVTLLQDSDPPLARAVADSREPIWGILSDPEKFKNH